MSIIFYKRPDFISRPDGPLNKTECERYIEKYRHLKGQVPPELSFENVVNNKTLPPCTLNDFMDYMVYVERNAENLQFYLWLQDYTRRFNALTESEQNLSPVWDEACSPLFETTPVRTFGATPEFAKELNFKSSVAEVDATSGRGLISPTTLDAMSFTTTNASHTTFKSVETAKIDANATAGLKWDAFTIQPFRSEITRVISHYITPDSPRELNLSHKDRAAVLHALQQTTHPSAFSPITEMVESLLRGQAHPNFVQWSICNGNKPKVLFVRTMGTTMVLLSLMAMVLLILSQAPRWYRIIPCILLWFGSTNLIASKKGMCMILTFNHQRDLKPWELDTDPVSTFGIFCKPAEDEGGSELESAKSGVSVVPPETNTQRRDITEVWTNEKGVKHWTLDSFGGHNQWDDQEWVRRYTKRSVIRRAFPGSTWVQAKGIRELQKHIIRVSQLWGLLITVIVVAGFTAIPNGNFY